MNKYTVKYRQIGRPDAEVTVYADRIKVETREILFLRSQAGKPDEVFYFAPRESLWDVSVEGFDQAEPTVAEKLSSAESAFAYCVDRYGDKSVEVHEHFTPGSVFVPKDQPAGISPGMMHLVILGPPFVFDGHDHLPVEYFGNAISNGRPDSISSRDLWRAWRRDESRSITGI